MAKQINELQVTIRGDKASYFINTLDEILTTEKVSTEGEEAIANLLHDCFGIGAVAADWKKKYEELRAEIKDKDSLIQSLAAPRNNSPF